MTGSIFKKATKKGTRLRLLLSGAAGSGKTFTSLKVANALAGAKGRVVVIDSERGSASKYSGDMARLGFEYDTCDLLETFGDTSPTAYIAAIHAAEKAGYEVLIIDSISHEWVGPGGALEMKDEATPPGGNSFAAWKDVTPVHNRFVDALVGFKGHVIGCARAKVSYVMEQNDKGKIVPRRIGETPIQRDGVEYEFDVILDMTGLPNGSSKATVAKTRYSAITGQAWVNIGSAPDDPFIVATNAFLADDGPVTDPLTGAAVAQASASPFWAALVWANGLPAINPKNRTMIQGQYTDWVKRYRPEYPLPTATLSPQQKLDDFRKWLEAGHLAFMATPAAPAEPEPTLSDPTPPPAGEDNDSASGPDDGPGDPTPADIAEAADAENGAEMTDLVAEASALAAQMVADAKAKVAAAEAEREKVKTEAVARELAKAKARRDVLNAPAVKPPTATTGKPLSDAIDAGTAKELARQKAEDEKGGRVPWVDPGLDAADTLADDAEDDTRATKNRPPGSLKSAADMPGHRDYPGRR